MNAKTRNDANRAAFFGFGRGDVLAMSAPMPDRSAEDGRECRERAAVLRSFITPEQRLINVADCLVDAVQSGRHTGRADEIRLAAEQLRDDLVRYFAGKLPPTPAATDECPF